MSLRQLLPGRALREASRYPLQSARLDVMIQDPLTDRLLPLLPSAGAVGFTAAFDKPEQFTDAPASPKPLRSVPEA